MLSFVPWILIPYDSLTHLLGMSFNSTAQTLPLTALFSIPYVLYRNRTITLSDSSTKLFKLLAGSASFLILVTLINVFLESVGIFNGALDFRLYASTRQTISFILGILSFLMFADAAARLGLGKIFSIILWSSIPSLLFVFVQLATGQFTLVENRVQGFSSEPSHLADYLVYALFPACIGAITFGKFRWYILIFATVALLMTYSSTGYMKALFCLFSLLIIFGHFVRGLLCFVLVFAFGYLAVLLNADNYVINMASLIWSNIDEVDVLIKNPSLIDRFFGFVGPAMQLNTAHGLLGFGFGGDNVYFERLFDADIAETIAAAKGDLLSISSLQGKILLYGGVIGYVLYLAIWRQAYLSADKTHSAKYILPSLFAGSMFSLGPFFLPYFWMWLALSGVKSPAQEVKKV